MSIAVVLPFFNAQETLSRSLASIANQSRKPREVILVNDGSTDNSFEIASRYASQNRWKIICNDNNRGIAMALNCGIRGCDSEWVARLDADDIWMSNHISCLTNNLNRNQTREKNSYVLMASRARMVDDSENTCSISSGPQTDMRLRRSFLWDNPIVHSAVAFKRDAAILVGGYRDVKWEDYDLWLRLLSIGLGCICAEVTSEHYIDKNGLSRIDRREALQARLDMQMDASSIVKKRWMRLVGLTARNKTRIQIALEELKIFV